MAEPQDHPRRLQSVLHQRWNEEKHSTTRLYDEITALGYRGSCATVSTYLPPLRVGVASAPTKASPPKVRAVAGWLMTDPVNLSKDHTHQLAVIRGRCPELDAMRRHVEAFAQMIRELLGDALDEWMDAVPADDLPQLHSFVTGLRRDQHAVVADLRLPYSSGPVEGVVNRIKLS